MADFLDEKHREIQARLKELEPLVEEYRRLQEADQALTSVASVRGGSATATAAPASSPRRARRSSASRRSAAAPSGGGSAGRRGRPRGSGTRANQALDLVKDRPGITIPEMAQ